VHEELIRVKNQVKLLFRAALILVLMVCITSAVHGSQTNESMAAASFQQVSPFGSQHDNSDGSGGVNSSAGSGTEGGSPSIDG
jgi:hypothetical protein